MENDTDYQQNLVLEQKYALLEMIRDANQALDDKANSLLQVSGLIVGVVAALSLTGLGQLIRGASSVNTSIIAQMFSALAFILLVVSIVYYNKMITPTPYSLPGSTDWDRTMSLYVGVSKQKSYDQVLSDVFNAIDSVRALNDQKSGYVILLGKLLIGQIVTLTIAIIAS